MRSIKKLAIIAVLTPLFAACSSGPSDSDVEELIQAQYDNANSIMDDAMVQAGDDEMAKAVSGMMAGMMPTLESVDNVSCDTTEGDNTYLCTADVTQTIGGNSRTDSGAFKVSDVNGEWVLTP
ncbi:MAG: hypothetical protein ACPHVZ_08755 [Psychrobacter sp.]|uniref:hypothetical protein n=1 Tax=Psychrobacter sp. 4Dc TaxID=888437 RepID=UPI000CB53A42|nr:hypothetical protein [Psychrobacter sp. 4Dc]MDN5665315.1 hypothetical protein [Psychrobacter sp.]PKH69294.1 hypothetical protein CXF61_00950 [Psychrobacter sp. 4Dc]